MSLVKHSKACSLMNQTSKHKVPVTYAGHPHSSIASCKTMAMISKPSYPPCLKKLATGKRSGMITTKPYSSCSSMDGPNPGTVTQKKKDWNGQATTGNMPG